MKSSKTIRFAVVGARRGASFIETANSISNVELVAICDSSPEALDGWRNKPGIVCYSDFDQVLNDPKIDAVCIATPVLQHAQQALDAMRAGKHVLSEVIAAYTIEDCWELIRTVEKTGLTYMMAENYCFRPEVLTVQQMVEQGIFGDLIYATGAYIHDCRSLFFTEEKDLTWRGEFRTARRANSYPTHALGPVCRWLGINRTDFLKTTSTWQSRSAAIPHYASRNIPKQTGWAEPKSWQHPDTVTTLIRTEKGVLIESRNDWASARPHHMTRYELQGTTASFTTASESANHDATVPLIWIEGRSPISQDGSALEWEPLAKYASEFEHPLLREHGEEASKTGHGGGDYFCLREFAQAIQEDRLPLIDVYDAVTWSSFAPLSEISVQQNNASIPVPDFVKSKGARR